MLVTTPDNYRRTRARHFTVQGVKSRHRRAAGRIGPGDRVCWYLVGIAGFVATATVTSPAFEDHRPIWVSTGREDPYPWRFRIARDVVREPDEAVPAASLATTGFGATKPKEPNTTPEGRARNRRVELTKQ